MAFRSSVGSKPWISNFMKVQNEIYHYVCLSHCWGNIRAMTTTSAALARNNQNIARESLPKTFQDAVEIVRSLGLQYLWIDTVYYPTRP